MSALKRIAAATVPPSRAPLIATHGTGAAERSAKSYSYLSRAGCAADRAGDAAGANDWRCHWRRPPGSVVTPARLSSDTIVEHVVARVGRRGYCVFTTTYGRGLLRSDRCGRHRAGERAPDRPRSSGVACRDRCVEGGPDQAFDGRVRSRSTSIYGRHRKIDGYIALSAPLRGSDLVVCRAALCRRSQGFRASARRSATQCGAPCQLDPGSPFLQVLSNPDPGHRSPGIDFTMIVTRYDKIAAVHSRTTPRPQRPQCRAAGSLRHRLHRALRMTADPIAVREIPQRVAPGHRGTGPINRPAVHRSHPSNPTGANQAPCPPFRQSGRQSVMVLPNEAGFSSSRQRRSAPAT